MDLFAAIVAVVFGLILGSFFNVVIYRLPLRQSIVSPGSHCPKCGRPVRPWENIPVLSYVFLQGKCAGCRWRIPARYPLIELTTAGASLILWLLVVVPALRHGLTPVDSITLIVQCSTLLLMIPVAIIDFGHLIIPESITIPGIVIAAAVSFLPGGFTPLQCVIGMISGSGFLYCAGLIGRVLFRKKETMGFGDVELLAFVGAGFGWQIALLTVMFGTFFGLIGALAYLARGKLSNSHIIPFGPFLGIGLWIAVLAGGHIVSAYFSFVDVLIR
jgi:leader peptidase (prepilin peptidase)/N-methyltransferase